MWLVALHSTAIGPQIGGKSSQYTKPGDEHSSSPPHRKLEPAKDIYRNTIHYKTFKYVHVILFST